MACSVLVSLFVSFSLDPMLSAYWADPHLEHHEKAWITRQLDKFNHWFNRQAQNYKRVIAWALDHRAAIAIIAVGTFLGSFALPTKGISGLAVVLAGVVAAVALLSALAAVVHETRVGPGRDRASRSMLLPVVPQFMNVGFGFFPEDDQAELNVSIEAPPGSNIEYTRIKSDEVVRQIETHKEVRYAYTTIGGGQTGAVDVAKIYVRLVPKNERSLSVEGISAELRKELKTVGGAKIAVFATDWGGGRKQVQLQARGNNTDELAAFADKALKAVEQVPGAVDVGLSTKGQKPELTVDLNRGVAGSIGVTVGQVAQALRPAFAGIDAGDWQDPSGEMRDVYVRLAPESRTRAADLRQLPLVIQGPNGAPTTAPLGQVATVTAGVGPAVINHLNRDKVVSVEFNTSGRSMGEVTNDALARMLAIPHPPDVRVDKGGEAQQQGELFGQIFLALGVAVGLMYLILVMQFGSFIDPLAIMLSLPLSLIGVMLGLAVTRNTINIMSLIGVILLMGIVAKNAILLIDFAKWAREKQGHGAARGADRGRRDPTASDSHDDGGADRGHAPGRARPWGGSAVSVTVRRLGDRRRDHVDAADAGRDPDVLRDSRRVADGAGASVRRERQAADGRVPGAGVGAGGRRLITAGGRGTGDGRREREPSTLGRPLCSRDPDASPTRMRAPFPIPYGLPAAPATRTPSPELSRRPRPRICRHRRFQPVESHTLLSHLAEVWAYVTLGASGITTEEAAPLVGGFAAHEHHLGFVRVVLACAHRRLGSWRRPVCARAMAKQVGAEALSEGWAGTSPACSSSLGGGRGAVRSPCGSRLARGSCCQSPVGRRGCASRSS